MKELNLSRVIVESQLTGVKQNDNSNNCSLLRRGVFSHKAGFSSWLKHFIFPQTNVDKNVRAMQSGMLRCRELGQINKCMVFQQGDKETSEVEKVFKYQSLWFFMSSAITV